MNVDEEASRKASGDDSSSCSDNYKEDEGKARKREKPRKKKERMHELSPAVALTKVENVIKDGKGSPSPILLQSSVSEEMHENLLNNDPRGAAHLLGMGSGSVPMLQ
eukprot:2327086-Karenia_brevis.AAC.1